MQKFLSKYALAAHLALLAVAPLFLFPFFNGKVVAEVLLWMTFLSFVWLFMEPSRRVDEFLYEARVRVWRSIKVDPLFWAFVLFLVVAFIRWLNDGVELVYDVSGKEWRWIVSHPVIDWLPGSGGESGFVSFAVLAAVATVVMACRHALGKSARMMFVFLASLFAAIASIVAVMMLKFGNPVVYDAAYCDYSSSSFAGSSFGLFFIASIVALAGMFESGWNKAMILFSFAVGSTFTGLCFFSPPAVIALYSVTGALFLVVSLACVTVSKGSVAFFKFLVALLFAAAVPLACYILFAPAELVELKMAVLGFELFPDDYFAMRKMYSEVASRIWTDGNIWHGGGIGSFLLFLKLDFTEVHWTGWISNGWWQFLAERGLVGLVMVVITSILMLFTYFARLFRSKGRRVFWPMALLGIFAAGVAVAEGFFNASFMRPEVFVSVGAFFALGASSFLPGSSVKDAKKE